MWQNGGYSSYYRKIKPKYSEPYHDHLDFNDSHEKSNVDYLYHRDFDKIEHIEKYKLLPDDVETTPENGKRMYDNIHGYFGEHYNNSNRHADVTVLDYEDGYANDFGKPDGKTWQNMFDISELPAQELKIIKEIKDDVKENKKEYARLRNLRNKFDTYECSICCLQTSPGVTGSIDEYKIVSAGSFSDVVNYEPEAATEDEPAPPPFRKSYLIGEGGTGPWNETLGEFYYLKNSVPNYQEYVINLEIARLQLAIQANQQFLESCENAFCPEDEYGCNDCDDMRAFKCCTCKPNSNGEVPEGCGELKFEAAQRIERLNRRLEEWFEYAEKFPEGYDRNWNKKAYFISKEPEIEKLNQTITPTSLFNVKSITRKSLRGSRYEQFARKYNVQDGQLGEWIYNAYLGNDPSLDPTQPGNHPIYDQKYMDYSTSGPGAYRDSSQKWWGIVRSDRFQPICDTDCRGGGDADFECNQFTCSACHNPEAGFWGGVNVDLTDVDRHTWVVGSDSPCGPCGCDQPEDGPYVPNPSTPVFEEDEQGPPWGLVAPQWHPNSGEVLLPGGDFNPYDFSQRWNFYLDDIAENTPVSIKRKEVQSYVRIEFESAIGLETLDEFPEGFIRDAGYEYFLPYLVMLTPGPFGKQGANKNVAVIGIDPYGFDVAVEPDDPDYGEDTTDGGMNLYPSEEWETERPYYTTSGNRGSRYYYGRYYGGSYYGRYYSSWWNKKAHAYDTLYYSSVNVSSGAPNSYYHFDYTAPLPVYHRYPYRRYGYYGYYGYNYYYGSSYWYNYNNYYGWNYGYDNYWYDVYDYESPSLDEQDSFGRSGNAWWGWGWYYGYRWIWETESEYRPGMPEDDVWKYDSSGNTDYGMVEPPQGHSFYYQRNNEENDFGRNFAAQFVVYSRRVVNSCSDSGYQCANPEGPVSSLGCPEDNIYCNCPCQELIPRKERVASRQELIDLGVDVPSTFLGITEYIWFIVDNDNNILEEFEGRPGASLNEVVGGGPFSGYGTIQDWLEENGSIEEKPTDEILEEAKRKTKECELISDRLGESWLGCMWSNLDDPISCNCPCRGDKFSDYVEYTRTWATYWDTPANSPLLRNAQMLQLNSQKALIVVNGDFSLKPGQLIKLNIPLGIDAERSESRVSGNWLVSQIIHSFATQQTHRMTVSLVRDTASVETQESSWVEWFKNILGL